MTDKKFREWVQRQPSCLSGRFSEYVNGEGRNLACHVRRASTSGTGFKAPFSCVPMTDDEHRVQHQQGEFACLVLALGATGVVDLFGGMTKDEGIAGAKQWFDEKAEEYRERWEREHG